MLSPASRVVHLGRPPGEPGEMVNHPIVLSSTFRQGGRLSYGRDGNPTWEAVEEVIGGLEGGSAVLFGSGLAAVAAVMESLPAPGVVVVAGDAYNGTRRFLSDVAARGRLRYLPVDVTDVAAVADACGEAVLARPKRAAVDGFGARGLLWLESPTNPLLAIADLSGLAERAHDVGMDVAVDNTFCTPLLQRPLDLGADVVVHSATKLMSGHSDVVLGAAVSRREDITAALARRRSLHGAVAGPFEAWILLRGLRTLDVRLERAQSNASELASRLAGHPGVASVLYPGLPGSAGHDLAKQQMRGFGTIVSFEVHGGAEGADAVAEKVRLLTPGTSLGGVETLIERRGRWEAEEALPPGLMRMSVGIEDVEDLWLDIEQALAHASAKR